MWRAMSESEAASCLLFLAKYQWIDQFKNVYTVIPGTVQGSLSVATKRERGDVRATKNLVYKEEISDTTWAVKWRGDPGFRLEPSAVGDGVTWHLLDHPPSGDRPRQSAFTWWRLDPEQPPEKICEQLRNQFPQLVNTEAEKVIQLAAAEIFRDELAHLEECTVDPPTLYAAWCHLELAKVPAEAPGIGDLSRLIFSDPGPNGNPCKNPCKNPWDNP